MKTLKDYKDSEIYRGDVFNSNLEILKTFKVVDGNVNLHYSEIKTFKDFKVEIVTGSFFCDYCKNLKSLQSSLKIVYWSFYCNYCKNLESLEGLPIIKDDLYCYDLPRLNIRKSVTSILNSGVPFEDINCEPELKEYLNIYLQFAKDPNDFVKLGNFKFKLKAKIWKLI